MVGIQGKKQVPVPPQAGPKKEATKTPVQKFLDPLLEKANQKWELARTTLPSIFSGLSSEEKARTKSYQILSPQKPNFTFVMMESPNNPQKIKYYLVSNDPNPKSLKVTFEEFGQPLTTPNAALTFFKDTQQATGQLKLDVPATKAAYGLMKKLAKATPH